MNDYPFKDNFATLVDLLRWRAQYQVDRRAYIFLKDGDFEEVCWTYQQLDQQARLIAARLQHLGQPGERVLLLYPAGLEYIAAFFGCLYAGMIAVPTYPPRLNRPAPRLQAIVADAEAGLALTTTQILSDLHNRFEQMPELKVLRWYATDNPELDLDADDWQESRLTAETVAFLQYTSGSTNIPVGVQISHSNLLHNLALIKHSFQVDSTSRCFSWLPLYHDMGLIGNVLEPLYAGIPLVLSSSTAFIERPVRWLQAITRYQSTISGGPNFAYQLCCDKITPEERATLDLSSWKVAFCGAEPIRAGTLDHFATTFASCGFRREAFYPCYGLAEATLMVSGGAGPAAPIVCAVEREAIEQNQVIEVAPNSETSQLFVSCGQALLDQKIVIVDPESLTQVPPNCVGEIWVSSPSISRGYWQQSEKNRQTFQAYLVDTGAGPFLRTGDLGFLKDGELFVTGRIKELIIMRGRNYYPQDIEQTAERSHPALQPNGGAAFSISVEGDEQLVIVYEVKRSQRHADVEEVARAIRRAVAEEQELPVYAVVLVKPMYIPRTSSGKTQRNLCRSEFMAGRLEAIGVSRLNEAVSVELYAVPETGVILPQTPTEESLAVIWAEVLEAGHVGVDDNFFELGGDSLLATRVVSRIRELFQVDLPLRTLFDTPTVAGLAKQVELSLRQGLSLEAPPIQSILRHNHLPLSFSQERMWFLHQLQPNSSAYNIAVVIRLKGQLNRTALVQSFDEIIKRHESLRTSFIVTNGQPAQMIIPAITVPLPVVDLRDLPRPERENHALILAGEAAQGSFDLGGGVLMHTILYQLDDDEHLLLLNMHHIISDAWSLGVIAQEMMTLYTAFTSNQPAKLPQLLIQYADFACWQRQWLQGELLEAQMAYWRERLAHVSVLELPTDRPRPAIQSYHGRFKSTPLSASLLQALKQLSCQEGTTLSMTLLAAFKTLLYRYTGQEDIAVGMPIANRRWLAVEGLIGTFVNTLVLRSNLSNNPSFRELLGRVRLGTLEAYAHQDLPFAKLVAELQPERDMSHSPLVQVMFNVINVPAPALDLPGLTVTFGEVDRGGAQFDLNLTVVDTAYMQRTTIEYNIDLFDDETIERMMGHWEILLAGIIANPDQPISDLPLLTEAERQQLLVDWNCTHLDYPDRCMHQLFEAQVEQTPQALALIADSIQLHQEEQLTYAELNRRANQLAHYLQKLGVGPEVCVGVNLERSTEMVIGVLGVLKAGGAYVPLDPAFPKDRLAFMVEDAQIPVLLTQQNLLAELPPHQARIVCLDRDWPLIAQESAKNPVSRVTTTNLAYILYTSGSTGKPKGVQIPHRALTNFLISMRQEPGLVEQDILLSVTTLSFDIAGLELYLPLITGARVVVVSREVAADGLKLGQKLDQVKATVMQATPATWQMLLDAGWSGQPNLKILCGGEALSRELANQLLDRCATLWNMYGPTETTIWSTVQRVERDQPITIGHPIANTQIYVLNACLQPTPIGVPGDLYIGGDGLARGYLNRPELTQEKFIPDPFSPRPDARLYKTGDLARYRADGQVEYMGRMDHQVKVRGFRIELGEIENVLQRHPAIQQAVVIAREDRPGDKRLVAYVIARIGQAPTGGELRDFLKESLPDYMLPTAFVFLETYPLTPNNKVDRRALPAPDMVHTGGSRDFVAPRNMLEVQLVQIWQEVLGIRPVGVTDSFFDLGGHSLLVVRLFTEIEQRFGKHLPIATLFQSPTIEQLAALLQQGGWSPNWSCLVPIQPGGSKPPFYCVHEFDGNAFYYYDLAQHLGADQPFYGLQARGLDGQTEPDTCIEDMAAHYVKEIRTFQPQGPYYLGGSSLGGLVAFEMAQQLHAQGQTVGLLALFDTFSMGYLKLIALPMRYRASRHLNALSHHNLTEWLAYILERARPRLNLLKWLQNWFEDLQWQYGCMASQLYLRLGRPLPPHLLDIRMRTSLIQAQNSYHPQRYPGRITFFRAMEQPAKYYHEPYLDQETLAAAGFLAGKDLDLMWEEIHKLGWADLAGDGLDIHNVPGPHGYMVRNPHAQTLAEQLSASLETAYRQVD